VGHDFASLPDWLPQISFTAGYNKLATHNPHAP